MKHLSHFFFLFNLFLFITFLTFGNLRAGDFVITGQLISESTGKPVAYANVLIKENGEGIASSSTGKFSLKSSTLPVTLQISHIAYRTKTIKVTNPDLSIIYLVSTVLTGEEVLVFSSRAVEGKTPVAFSTLDREEIERSYTHQDVPMVLSELPGVYSYSDAGNGVGYSYLKIRGFQQDRIGVMINGIPLNDPEAHAVYWVDHGDILAATGDIQLQRGVGNSLYGASVFGGTVNLATNFHSVRPGFAIAAGYGNYTESGLDLPSKKLSLSYVGNLWKEKVITLYTRFSNLSSDGYRKGSGTEQNSFHAGIEKSTEKSLTRIEGIFGDENTAFSWEGVIPIYGYDLKDRKDRRYNYYADPDYNGDRGDANKDVFKQSILSVQHSRKIMDGLFSFTLYDVNGDGYYEQFKGGRDVVEYNLTGIVPDTLDEVDLIRKKWLKNGYSGLVYQYSYPFSFGSITFGGDARFYKSKHFGKVVELFGDWSLSGDHKYYFDRSKKNSFSFYLHSYLNITEQLGIMADIRYLGHRYDFDQDIIGAFKEGYNFKLKYDFIDPHFGINYKVNDKVNLFGNVSTAHREPTDGDLYDHDDPEDIPKVDNMTAKYAKPLVDEEFLVDYETGLKFNLNYLKGQLNLYRMDFRNELIPVEYRYYDADEVLHANAGETIHQGVEFEFQSQPLKWLRLQGNFTYSDNRFRDFHADSIGWSGWGGIADYSDKIIPAFPAIQTKGKIIANFGGSEVWLQLSYIGKQYIDFANTEDAAIDAYTVVNVGSKVNLPAFGLVKSQLNFRINNLFDTLYETFGYNYYDGWPPYQVDSYWPAATRNYYIMLTINF